MALLAGAPPAIAHPTLLFSDPAAEVATGDSPGAITLVFNEAVTAGPDALVVLDSAGKVVPVGPTATARAGRAITAAVPERLGLGVYRVRWQVTGSDGDLMGDEYRFAVGSGVLGAAEATTATGTSWPDAVVRWLLFAGLALALGGVVADLIARRAREGRPGLPSPHPLAPVGALTGLVAVVTLGVLLVVQTGSLASLWNGQAGIVLLVEAAGFGVGYVAWRLLRASARILTLVPLAAVVVAEGVRSHANTAAPGWGALLTGVHVAAAALWVGALTQVVVIALAWRSSRAPVHLLYLGYARVAAWVFATVVSTGAVSALLLVPFAAWTGTRYGLLLLVKLGGVAAAAVLALGARRWVRRRNTRAVLVATRVEIAALAVVLAMSATLSSTPPASSQPAAAPVLGGQVVQVGTMAGQIGVTVQAGEQTLVVRLTSPRTGDYYSGDEPQDDLTLSAQVAGPGQSVSPVELTACGAGCFTGPVDWRSGDNILGLRASSATWRGGTANVLVPWPGTPGAAHLERAVSALRSVGNLTVYEAVTSDASAGLPEHQRLRMTGRFFVSQEPYADGSAPVSTQISQPGEPVRLALGYPAAHISVTLTLDAAGRISEETLTDATHLIHRRFVYPETD
ncbi:copper resistance CopC/CopD family protein [Terrabacter sp. C0L_2]|uniref:copper resistance CopC/CopD family protein n=1 Tax=Terrabacter sp. C0L_2 TaxID=3108389 RepID=UPI002ED4EE21|nr:copper resistance CopC family protein [Terrabacter sp. C0L_2]